MFFRIRITTLDLFCWKTRTSLLSSYESDRLSQAGGFNKGSLMGSFGGVFVGQAELLR